MMNSEVVKDLLVNLLFVLLPAYLLLLFGSSKPSRSILRRSIISGLVGSILVVLCMAFPITIVNNHIFDLRQIPLIIGFLYFGRTTGIIIFLTLIINRIFLGGTGLYGAIFINAFLMVLLFLVQHKFNLLSVKHKFLLTSALTLCSSILINLFFLLFHELEPIVLSITTQLFLVQSIGLFIIIYSNEKLKRDILIEKTLHKAEKAKIVSQMAAAVSHEIRNPLTVTKGFLQFVLNQSLPKQTGEYLKMAQEELIHAENVINDYLTFAKPALDNPTALSIIDEINKIINLITPYSNMQSVHINFDYNHDIKIMGEPQKFHQCISNILKNSIEAMPNGGRIDIRLFSVGYKIVLSIADTGMGMDHEELQRLGEPYFSTKETGTGLGMMVVFSIIRSMNGKFDVSSEKDKGTIVRLEFPFDDNISI